MPGARVEFDLRIVAQGPTHLGEVAKTSVDQHRAAEQAGSGNHIPTLDLIFAHSRHVDGYPAAGVSYIEFFFMALQPPNTSATPGRHDLHFIAY